MHEDLNRRLLMGACAVMLAGAGRVRADAVTSAREVLQRTLGGRASEFDLRAVADADGLDVFVLSARNGRVSIAGSSGVAIARGAYEYIRHNCRGMVCWEGSRLNLPERMPDCAETRVVCPCRYRHYFNVCTFGYTTVWWDWQRWQREIDWMALHGINNPLAMNGQEHVWRRVWRQMGLTDAEVDAFFSGPAFLPWHRMGNLNSHAGPLPRDWEASQAQLQKKILARERELGMSPVIPAFSGFVPEGFKRAHPQAKVRTSSGWAGFAPTFTLDARDPLFEEIGRRFIEEYRKEFGSDHLYLADTFNEMTPPVGGESKLADLKAYGEAVFRSIRAGDPDGVWVMQGWLFYNERSFWGAEEVKALLSGVPDDRMILLDLACDQFEVWKLHPSFRAKQWISCALHNFGQNTALFGNLADYAARPAATLHDAQRGRMVGMGLTMEGIEQNAVVYELLTDAMWRDRPIDLDRWIHDYCECRYGECPAAMENAWKLARERVYGGPGPGAAMDYQLRPSLDRGAEAGDSLPALRQMLNLFLSCADRLGSNPLYQRDLVDFEKRFLGECASAMLDRAFRAWESGDERTFTQCSRRFLETLDDIDQLVGTRDEHRISRWIEDARRWGHDPASQDFYERNARLQVTVWGGPVLADYARKEWSGLIAHFYAERWKRFFARLRESIKTHHFDDAATGREIAEWEARWTQDLSLPATSSPTKALTVTLAQQLFDKHKDIEPLPPTNAGIAVGKPVTVSGGTEGGHRPEFAVDGRSSNRDAGWYASPYPQWLQIDLQQPREIGRVDLATYWDGERYYQYTVELSLDGKVWARVVDESKNTSPAGRRGRSHTIKPTTARYVRVNMLFNSANVGVHLLEVRVFAPQINEPETRHP